MKCINCYREIADGLKFCPKCGTMQPEDREAYELEHPELAEAIPEEEILEKMNLTTEVPRTAMSRDEFVQLIASDPHCDSIANIADEGVATYGLVEKSAVETWYAKCAELIGDKQGFYPYFMKLLSQQPEKARNLLISQVAEDMNLAMPLQETISNGTTPQMSTSSGMVNGGLIPPPPPVMPPPPPTLTAITDLNPPSPISPAQPGSEGMEPTNPDTYQVSDGLNSVECPICHQFIPFGTHQCPYCKQLLDWSYSSQATEQEVGEKPKRGALWFVLALIMAILIGGAGYYIYTSVKDKTHKLKHRYDDDDDYDYYDYRYNNDYESSRAISYEEDYQEVPTLQEQTIETNVPEQLIEEENYYDDTYENETYYNY
ncbi:MAG: hypothetical protein IKW83_09345 [Muribaculaceae bacterium]|nr:hypothetical protein [Muribaculaceae bacterium]